ncbi:glycosyltransferase family 2 protein [Clostridium beijerinckii]|uniref:glycosyltransferase family 2 protein n=1 Tax=Clostridium beijerinckii TaxID=1520 RepID=UPI0003D39C83|nr:glycosyltransferase family 2 protein [Clostridium beijerinckii]
MDCKYDVSIIIVNYNGKRYIDTLFESLDKLVLDDIKLEIVFVDNASSDDSIKYLKDKYNWDNLNIVRSDVNTGFAGGNNLGVEKSNGKYIVFLNNDTRVDKMWLKELYTRILSDDNIGMINSKLLFFYDFIKIQTKTNDKFKIDKEVKINGKSYEVENKFAKNLLLENKMTCFGHSYFYLPLIDYNDCDYEIILTLSDYNKETDFIVIGENIYKSSDNGKIKLNFTSEEIIKFKKSLIQNAGSSINENFDGYDIGMGEEDGEKYCKEYEINNACGASIIMLKDDFIKAGMFDEDFFMYYEDTDLSYRVKKLGKKIIFHPKSIVRHIHTGSSKEWSPFFIFHVVRNKALFVYKNISKIKGMLMLLKGIIKKDANIRNACISGIKIIIL